MKKEHFLFLTLIMASAIVVGSTIGLVNNIDVLASLEQGRKGYYETDKIEYNEVSRGTSTDRVSHKNIDIVEVSEQEKEEIINMLKYLGMGDNKEYSEFIEQFQRENSLNITGYINHETLDSIVRQVTVNRILEKL